MWLITLSPGGGHIRLEILLGLRVLNHHLMSQQFRTGSRYGAWYGKQFDLDPPFWTLLETTTIVGSERLQSERWRLSCLRPWVFLPFRLFTPWLRDKIHAMSSLNEPRRKIWGQFESALIKTADSNCPYFLLWSLRRRRTACFWKSLLGGIMNNNY